MDGSGSGRVTAARAHGVTGLEIRNGKSSPDG